MTIAMAVVVIGCFAICSFGLQKGVEKITKVMMICLLAIMAVLAIHSLTLSGAKEGLRFYLFRISRSFRAAALWTRFTRYLRVAFFTLSIGMGSIAIFGSYIDKSVLCPARHCVSRFWTRASR